MPSKQRFDVAVIGGGPAGMAAALAAHKAGAQVLVLERNPHLGGILRQCIHPGFGLTHFKQELTGPEYAQRFINMVAQAGIEVWTQAMVLSIDAEGAGSEEGHVLECMSPAGMQVVCAKAVVLAMGCRERTRSEIKTPGTRPAGVFTAGLAQQYINVKNLKPGHRAVILGSGDIGLIMARRCALEGIEVEGVYEIMPYANGLERNIKNCLDDFGIPLHLSTTVSRIIGSARLEAVEVSEVDENLRPVPGAERRIECDTLLLSVGLIPENELSSGAGVELDPRTRGAVVNERLMTSVPGIFSCGNVLHVHDLADNVSNEADRAGKAAAAWALEGAGMDEAQEKLSVSVSAGGMAGYVLPTKIDHLASTKLNFRVRRPVDCARVRIRCNGETLFEGKPRAYKPSIMEQCFVTEAVLKKTGPGAQLEFSVDPYEYEVQ